MLSTIVNFVGVWLLSDIAYDFIPLALSVAVIFIVFVVAVMLFISGFSLSMFVTSYDAVIP